MLLARVRDRGLARLRGRNHARDDEDCRCIYSLEEDALRKFAAPWKFSFSSIHLVQDNAAPKDLLPFQGHQQETVIFSKTSVTWMRNSHKSKEKEGSTVRPIYGFGFQRPLIGLADEWYQATNDLVRRVQRRGNIIADKDFYLERRTYFTPAITWRRKMWKTKQAMKEVRPPQSSKENEPEKFLFLNRRANDYADGICDGWRRTISFTAYLDAMDYGVTPDTPAKTTITESSFGSFLVSAGKDFDYILNTKTPSKAIKNRINIENDRVPLPHANVPASKNLPTAANHQSAFISKRAIFMREKETAAKISRPIIQADRLSLIAVPQVDGEHETNNMPPNQENVPAKKGPTNQLSNTSDKRAQFMRKNKNKNALLKHGGVPASRLMGIDGVTARSWRVPPDASFFPAMRLEIGTVPMMAFPSMFPYHASSGMSDLGHTSSFSSSSAAQLSDLESFFNAR